MQKPSQNYLNDSADNLPLKMQQQIDAVYLSNLNTIDFVNPKLLVVFSGGNAVGKSTLAAKIQKELTGLVLENDVVKAIIKNLYPELDQKTVNLTTWQYCLGLYKRLPEITKNGLVVRDGVIDWYYDRILPLFAAQEYELFVVGFDVSKQLNTQLIVERGDKETVTTERLLGRMEEHQVHIQRFRSEYPVDVVLAEATLFDHDMVISALKRKITSLRVHEGSSK
jgi:adenylate kinase family enzyme